MRMIFGFVWRYYFNIWFPEKTGRFWYFAFTNCSKVIGFDLKPRWMTNYAIKFPRKYLVMVLSYPTICLKRLNKQGSKNNILSPLGHRIKRRTVTLYTCNPACEQQFNGHTTEQVYEPQSMVMNLICRSSINVLNNLQVNNGDISCWSHRDHIPNVEMRWGSWLNIEFFNNISHR